MGIPTSSNAPLEAEGTAEQEGDKILPPVFCDARRFVDQLAAFPDPVSGDVGANVRSGSDELCFAIPWFGDVEDRTGLGISPVNKVCDMVRREGSGIGTADMSRLV